MDISKIDDLMFVSLCKPLFRIDKYLYYLNLLKLYTVHKNEIAFSTLTWVN